MEQPKLLNKEEFKQELKQTFIDFYYRCQNPKNKLEEKENKVVVFMICFTIAIIALWLMVMFG